MKCVPDAQHAHTADDALSSAMQIRRNQRLCVRCLLNFLLTAFTMVLMSCGQQAPAETSAPHGELRIVSLSPALSRTLVDLELGRFVVGRTPYCTSLDQSITVVGDLHTVDYEQLLRLRPTHILVQPPASGVDPQLLKIARAHSWLIAQWRLNSIDDISRMVEELPDHLYPESRGDAESARTRSELIERTRDWKRQLIKATAPLQGDALSVGRILVLNAVDPVMAFGTGTYLDDMLAALGGNNAVKDRGWVQLSLEDIVRLAPDAIILVRPGSSPSTRQTEFGPLATMDISAVHNQRLALLCHPDALLPSSSVIHVAHELRAILQQFAGDDFADDNRS